MSATNPRPPVREASPRPGIRDAAARAKEILENRSDNDGGTDRFHIDPSVVPDGWAYEYKRTTVYGKPDPAYDLMLLRQGWEPVPFDRHSNVLAELDGMRLYERPKVLTDAAQKRYAQESKSAIRAQIGALDEAPEGQLPRDAHPNTKGRVRTSVEAMEIPSD